MCITVVDDEAAVRKALGRLLRSTGFDVETFASGTEFLDSLNTHRPDCVILDLHLPGLSGLEIQHHLSRKQLGLPCIVITGKDEAGLGERVLDAGAAAFLRKPLDQEALLGAITAVLPSRQPEDDSQRTVGSANREKPLSEGGEE